MTVASRADLMREFVECLESRKADKALSLCTEGITWETPMGTFKGAESMKRYINWIGEVLDDVKFTESGNGVVEQGDKAFFEHTISGIMQGEKISYLAICSYEFEGDKISRLRTAFDRLTIAEQASSNQFIPKKLVNTIIGQMQKGLN